MPPAAPKLTVGLELHCVRDLPEALDAAISSGFEFAAVPLFHPRYRRDTGAVGDAVGAPAGQPLRDVPATRSDLVMGSSRWSTSVVGSLSPWLALDEGGAHPRIRRESEAAIRQELAWASHLGVPAVLAPRIPPTSRTPGGSPLGVANYAAHLLRAVEGSGGLHFWVRVPLTWPAPGPADADAGPAADAAATADKQPLHAVLPPPPPPAAAASRDPRAGDPWEGWHALRSATECHPHVSVCLEMGADLPPPAAVARWVGEPVKAALLPTHVFLTNRAGFPTLSRQHQLAVGLLLQYRVQLVLQGRPHVAGGYTAYLQYLSHVAAKMLPLFVPSFSTPGRSPVDAYMRLAAAAAAGEGAPGGAAPPPDDRPLDGDEWEALSGYLDVLQAPLQPLADNLESATYETFERDPVKYAQYEAAVAAALRNRPVDGPPATVLVVGAGRGPLVRRVLAASDATGRRVRVIAVEKNPNAVTTLRNLRDTEPGWAGGRVTVVASDMRHLVADAGADGGAPPAHPGAPLTRIPPADLLVSELLGSLGDNELSPECLDGVMRFLRPPPPPGAGAPAPRDAASGGGLSIPSASTSFLAPVSSHKLWAEARSFGAATGEERKWMETPYVVRAWRAVTLAPPVAGFTFHHPPLPLPPRGAVAVGEAAEAGGVAEGGAPDNRRYACLRWTLPGAPDGPSHLLHGFIGYFDAALYTPPGGAVLPASSGCAVAPPEGAGVPGSAGAASLSPDGSVHISTLPSEHTPGMFSWFPLFLPLRCPVRVAPGEVVELHLWRCVSAARVWYEWALGGGAPSPVHNPGGRSYGIGL